LTDSSIIENGLICLCSWADEQREESILTREESILCHRMGLQGGCGVGLRGEDQITAPSLPPGRLTYIVVAVLPGSTIVESAPIVIVYSHSYSFSYHFYHWFFL